MDIYEATQVDDELTAAFQHLLPQLSPTARIPTRAQIQEMIDSPAVTLLLARAEGGLVGMLTLVAFRTPTGQHAWIEDVVVDEAARGKGIGEALTRAALERAKTMGVGVVNLTSRPAREAANRLYVRLGFQLRHTNVYFFPIPHE